MPGQFNYKLGRECFQGFFKCGAVEADDFNFFIVWGGDDGDGNGRNVSLKGFFAGGGVDFFVGDFLIV